MKSEDDAVSGYHEVFPVSRTSYLDRWWRRLKYQPGPLVNGYVHPGDTALDIGCGTGLFTLPIARRVGENGQVIAVDLQEEMLKIVKEKATRKRTCVPHPASQGRTAIAGARISGADRCCIWMLCRP